jgi:hypothetical protein
VRYPYDRFLRFLVSRKVDVNAILTRHQLPTVGSIWIAECRTEIRDHGPYALAQYIDSENEDLDAREGILEWAEQKGFRSLWAMQREFDNCPAPAAYDQAYQIFSNPPVRALLGCLLLSRASEEETSSILKDHYGVELDTPTLGAYRHLWWDVASVPRKAWDAFVDKLVNKEERSYIAFGLTSPSANDVRDMMGLDTPVDDVHIVDSIIGGAYAQYRQAMQQPHPEESGAMRWADLALRAIGVKRSGAPKVLDTGPPTADFHNMFSVEVTKTKHATLAELHGKIAMREDPSKIATKDKEAK